MPGATATTLTSGVAARTVDAVKRYGTGSTVVHALADGRLAGELPAPTAEAVLEAMKRLERRDPPGPAGV